MTPLRVLVVDDEPLARRRLEQHLERSRIAVCVGAASSCREGRTLLCELRPDVVLLDVSLRDGTGFDLIDQLDIDDLPIIIVVTAFDRQAVRAFDAKATDFLVKPVAFARLEEALQKAWTTIRQRERAILADELEELVANLRAQSPADRSGDKHEAEFWVRHRVSGFVRVSVSAIRYIGSEDDYVRLVTSEGSHLMRGTLKDLEKRLDPQQFVRIHRSAIVRLAEVEQLLTNAGSMEAVLSCGTRLRVGRPQAKRLRALLATRMGSQDRGKNGQPLIFSNPTRS